MDSADGHSAAQVAEAVEDEEEIASTKIDNEFENVLKSLSGFRAQITVVQQGVRGLEKTVKKTFKDMKRRISKSKTKNAARRPSGFARPSVVSAELCEFMNKPAGTEVARTDATQYLIQYIEENNLQNPDDRRCIKLDDRLQQLLGVADANEITYFQIQRYMNRHFGRGATDPPGQVLER